MVFFQRAPLIYHVGHVSFRGCRPECLVVVPHVPRSPARSAALGVVAWRPSGDVGCSECPFADWRRSRYCRSPGADGQASAGEALGSARSCAGMYGASVRSALDLGQQLAAEGMSPRGGGAQELCYPLQ